MGYFEEEADLGEAGGVPLCDKVVAVLGDDNTYPCVLERGHPGRCQPDYEAV